MSTNTGDGLHISPLRAIRGRWILYAGLLISEYLVALLVFDSERLPITDHEAVFALLGESMWLIIVVVSAALLIGGRPSEAEKRRIVGALGEQRRTWPLFVGHLLTYAFALGITTFVFNSNPDLEHPWLWVVLWAASATCSVVLLVVAMVPRAALRPLAGPVLRALASGIVVGVVALLAGKASSVLWYPMSRSTLELVGIILEFTGHDVISIPEEFVIGTPRYEVWVDRPCSGYEGIGLIVSMLGVYLFLFRKSLQFPRALILLPIGVALIWLANSLRIAALIAVGTWISPEIAEGGFHSAAGWLLFCVITLGLVAASQRSGWFALGETNRGNSPKTAEGAYLLPLLFLVATAMISSLFTADFDYFYAARVVTPLIPFWLFRGYYKDFRWSRSWETLGLGIVVFVIWVALEPEPDPGAAGLIPETLAKMSPLAATFWLVARVLGSVVVIPIAEELAFRGYLLRRLIDADFTSVSPKHFTLLSFLVSSLAFGAAHGRWLAATVAGMIFAGAQYRRGQIADAIVAHAVANALIATYVLVFGRWAFW